MVTIGGKEFPFLILSCLISVFRFLPKGNYLLRHEHHGHPEVICGLRSSDSIKRDERDPYACSPRTACLRHGIESSSKALPSMQLPPTASKHNYISVFGRKLLALPFILVAPVHFHCVLSGRCLSVFLLPLTHERLSSCTNRNPLWRIEKNNINALVIRRLPARQSSLTCWPRPLCSPAHARPRHTPKSGRFSADSSLLSTVFVCGRLFFETFSPVYILPRRHLPPLRVCKYGVAFLYERLRP